MSKELINCDIAFIADHFILVTTMEVEHSPDSRDVESQALEFIQEQYGEDFAKTLKSAAKQVSIEVVVDKEQA